MPAPLTNPSDWRRNLAGIDEIATQLVVSKSAVVRWADEGLLPDVVDYLALGRVWNGDDLKLLREALSAWVEPPPEDGRCDRKRARRYASFLRRVRRDAEADPVTDLDLKLDDPAEASYYAVKAAQWREIYEYARYFDQPRNQNGNPSTGTSSSSDTR